MRLISWNTNGLRSTIKQNYFEPLFAEYTPDILCLQETKATPEQLPNEVVNVPGYHSFFTHPKAKKGYSGVALYSKEKPISVSYDFPPAILKKFHMGDDQYGDPAEEGRLLIAEFKHFYVVNVYTPNSKGDLSRIPLRHKLWDPAFLATCKLLEKKKPVIFCGDLNVAHQPIDLARPKENEGHHGFTKEEREGIEKIIKAGFIDTFRHFYPDQVGAYTYWDQFSHARDRNVGWRIDYFFASEGLKSKLKSAAILSDYYGSDHCPIVLDLK
jgi:exodeoxyribonuclease-3